MILVPEGLIEFIPEMGTLIQEINEAVAQEFTGDIKDWVLSKLTGASKDLFELLPESISV